MSAVNPITVLQRLSKASSTDRVKLRRQLLEVMNPDLRVWYESVEAKVGDRVRENLVFYWNLGKETSEIHNNEAKYGARAIDFCSACLNESKTVLYKAMQFYRSFSEEELNHLLSVRMKDTGRPVLWSHVMVLMVVDSKTKRMAALNQLLKHNWNDEELKRHIEQSEGKTSEDRRNAGRKVKIPATIDKMLHHMDLNLRPVEKKFSEVWNSDAHGLIHLVNTTPPDEYSPGMLVNVEQMMEVVGSLREGAALQYRQLQKAKMRLEYVLGRRAEKEAEEESGGKAKAKKEPAMAVE